MIWCGRLCPRSCCFHMHELADIEHFSLLRDTLFGHDRAAPSWTQRPWKVYQGITFHVPSGQGVPWSAFRWGALRQAEGVEPPFLAGAPLTFALGHRVKFYSQAESHDGESTAVVIVCSGLNGRLPTLPSAMQLPAQVLISLEGTYGPSASRMYAPHVADRTDDIKLPRAPNTAHAEFLELCLDLLVPSQAGMQHWTDILCGCYWPRACSLGVGRHALRIAPVPADLPLSVVFGLCHASSSPASSDATFRRLVGRSGFPSGYSRREAAPGLGCP